MKNKTVSLLITLCGLMGMCSCQPPTPPGPSHVDYASEYKLDMNSKTLKEEVKLKQCIDGDTTHFYNDHINPETGLVKARYLGIDTPESTGKIQPWGKQASNFNKERLTKACSIIIESEDTSGVWTVDSTGDRNLCYVWYKLNEADDYKCLNLEIMQEGLCAAKNVGGIYHSNVFSKAYTQAMNEKLKYFSNEKDPLYDYGEYISITLRGIREGITDQLATDPESEDYYQITGCNFRFEGVVTRVWSNSFYIQDYDAETDSYYGLPVFAGYNNDDLLADLVEIGNRLSVAATVSEDTGFGYQASGLTYLVMKPNNSKNTRLVSKGNEVVTRTITYAEINDELKAWNMMDTQVKVENVTVTSVYTTTAASSSSKGALTLTCKDSSNNTITIRTEVLKDDSGNVISEDYYNGKNITVTGLVDRYNEKYQIHVYLSKDIIIND